MGQEIVYCHKCQSRLIGSDFDKGKAFRFQNVTWCGDCARQYLDSLPPAERAALQPNKIELPKASTSRIPLVRGPADPSPSGRYRPMTDSTNLRMPSAPAKKSSPLPLILGVVGGLIALVVVIAVASSGSRRPPAPPPDHADRPDPAPPPPRDPLPSPEREKEARRLHDQAKTFAIANSADLAGQLDRFRQAAFAADGTSISEIAKRDFEAADARLRARIKEDGTKLDEETRPLLEKGDFKAALAALEAARARHAAPEWTREVERRAAAAKELARLRFTPLKAAGVEARQRRKDAELAQARAQVAALGVDELLREFDEAVAVAVPLPAPLPAGGAPVPVYEDGFAAGWRDWSWNGKVEPKSTVAFEGSNAIAWAPSAQNAGLYFHATTPLEADQFQSVTFALRRVDADFSFGVTLYTADAKNGKNIRILDRLGAPDLGAWKRYVVPLSEFEVQGKQITGLVIQAYRTSTEPCLFVDSVAFLRAAAADSVKPPDKPALSPAAKAHHERWLKAADHALARDYAQAAKELEASLAAAGDPAVKAEAQADLDAFKAAQAVLADVLPALAKWPRGQNLAVEVREAAGRRRLDDPVRRAEAFRAELRGGPVEFGEIAAASLAEIYLARAKRSEAETRGAALLCAIEGDAPAAKRISPALPAKYGERTAADGPRDIEARRLFAEADLEHRAYPTRSASLEKFAKLQADYKDTAFARRNQASIAARADSLKELYFAPGDLRAAGVFALRRHAKGEVGWTASEDVSDKAQRKEHFVEAEFSAAAGSEYRAWVHAGACCVETFTFFLQATELEAPDAYSPTNVAKCDPGGTFFTPVLPSISFLKKLHVQHGGRKEPSRFEWVALPPLRFPTAGPKKIRIISDQEGFTASALFLSFARRQPPPVSEAAELERARPDVSELLDAGGSVRAGVILREVWTGIGGNNLTDLTKNPAFKGRPNQTFHPDSFATPRNPGDNYGTRMRGYLHAPQTGAYTFWLCSDDDGQLLLSTDENPANKAEICVRNTAVQFGNWNASTKSQPVQLVKGRRYYVEALQKEGGGDDHLLVGWQLPDGTLERPIPGKRLSAFDPSAADRVGVSLSAPAPGFSIAAPGPIAIQADVSGPGAVSRIDVVQGSTRIGEAKGTPAVLTWSAPAPGAYPLAARLVEKSGRVVVSKPVLVTVGELTFHRAVDLNGFDGLLIDDRAWQGTAPDLAKTGTGFERQDVELRQPTDPARARMIRSSIAAREGTKASIPAPPGKYLVYLYAWEPDDAPLPFDVVLNGKAVLSGHKFSGVGDWARLGPWPVEPADGRIELASRGYAHFSGIEIWRHGSAPVAPTERARTEVLGGPGGAGFEEAPEGNRMITGLRLTVHEKRHVKTFQAIYGEQPGEVHGQPSADKREILAKPGYALGGIQVRGGDRVLAFRAVFMRISGPVLSPSDRYESEWIVGDEAGTTMLGGTGAPIVGLHGRRGNDVDAIGLVFLK
jgi:hypothetical protein